MNAMGMSRRIGRPSALAWLLTAALAASGCGDASGGREDAAPGGAEATTAGERPAAGDAAPTEVRVDRSYWYAGFKVTLGVARLIAPSGSGGATPVVAIEATFQNLNPADDAEPTAYALLTSGADSYDEMSKPHAELPEVPAQRSKTGVIAIEVDDRFRLADAVLTIGEPKTRQAVVPLATSDGLISLEPRPIKIEGRVHPGERNDVFMTMTGGEVRADSPSQHAQAAAGEEYVMLSFTATNTGPAGMSYVFDRDLNLVLPDGTKVATADSCSHAQVHIAPHSTVRPEGPACFAVPTPSTGGYQLVWDNADKRGLRFSIS